MWIIFQDGKTGYNYFNVISIIATPLFLIEKSNLTYPLFSMINKSLEQTDFYLQKGFRTILIYEGIPA